MAFLVVLILNDPELSDSVLDAWEAVGVRGVTVAETTGLGRIRRAMRDDLPLMPSLLDVLRGSEVPSRMFFSVVENEAAVDRLVQATHTVIGDFNDPHTGLLFVQQLYRVYGLNKRHDH